MEALLLLYYSDCSVRQPSCSLQLMRDLKPRCQLQYPQDFVPENDRS